jgi:hypothetical protein
LVKEVEAKGETVVQVVEVPPSRIAVFTSRPKFETRTETRKR